MRTVEDKYIEGQIPGAVANAALRGGMRGQEIPLTLLEGYKHYDKEEFSVWDLWLQYAVDADSAAFRIRFACPN
ncbi:MAG: hypothetical protein HYV77_02390 [Candidatus Wildermuthbacteria bacterium]|nr:hypothetical protein [Candidatus Wildermuthbacteria bacterium]